MIYTITLNPAIDYYLGFREFQEGKLNSAESGYTLPGGKGINVSKVLRNYEVKSRALGFVGGFTGEFIKKNLHESGIDIDFTELEEDTRINVKINNDGTETEISGISPKISDENLREFLEKLKNVTDGDIVVLSGSVPKSLNDNIYAEIIESLPEACKVILDTRGKAFDLALRKGVYLIKPNQHEIAEYFGREIESREELVEAGKELQKLGAENVLISLGGEGSILITSQEIFEAGVPKGELISSVGAGDSMVAGFIYGVAKGEKLEEAYRYGIASGSGTAFSQGLVTKETMETLYEKVEVKSIKI